MSSMLRHIGIDNITIHAYPPAHTPSLRPYPVHNISASDLQLNAEYPDSVRRIYNAKYIVCRINTRTALCLDDKISAYNINSDNDKI